MRPSENWRIANAFRKAVTAKPFCEIKPTLGGPDIGYIRRPLLIGRRSGKVLGQQICGDPPFVLAVRGFLEAAFLMCLEIVLAHQTGDAIAADSDVILFKIMPNPRRAIGSTT